MSDPICDFCNEPAPLHKRYEAKNLQIGNTTLASAGDWCACPVCARMIDSRNWEGLLEYSVASFMIINPKLASEADVRLAVRDLLKKFRESRRG